MDKPLELKVPDRWLQETQYFFRMVDRGVCAPGGGVAPVEVAVADADRAHAGSLAGLKGMTYNPFNKVFSLGSDADVNYILHAQKPGDQ